MKKLILGLLLTGLLAGGAFAQAPERGAVFSVSAGLLYDSEEQGLAQWGLNLWVGFRLSRHLVLSPEAMFAGSTGHSFFYPGLLLNYMGSRMFVGAGLVKPIEMAGQGDTALSAKFVVGYVGGSIIASGFYMGSVETDQYRSLFEHYRIGVTFGFRF
jgi:hypothetical protein